MLRFLWFDNVLLDEPTTIELLFARVVFRVSTSLFLLNATVKNHLEMYLGAHSETVTVILQSIYVDDVVLGAVDEENAYKLYLESKEILRNGSFNLSSLPVVHRCETISTLQKIQTPKAKQKVFWMRLLSRQHWGGGGGGTLSHKKSEQKILGVCWYTHSD